MPEPALASRRSLFSQPRRISPPTFVWGNAGGLLLLLAVGLSGGAEPATAQEQSSDSRETAGVSLNEAERAFQKQLSNVILNGRFTVEGKPEEAKPEKYQIYGVTKIGKHNWLVKARIAYGPGSENLPPLPIPVQVHWAGDTPVLSLTDLTIPGVGTFTSRVMFYEGRYAGTWQHGEKGGHLFGTISPAPPEGEPDEHPADQDDSQGPK